MMKKSLFPNITDEAAKCQNFLLNYVDSDNPDGGPKYGAMLQAIANRTSTSLNLDLDDVLAYEGDKTLVANIEGNTERYVKLFCAAADSLLPDPNIDLGPGDITDVWLAHRQNRMRQQREERIQQQGQAESGEGGSLPSELTRRYQLHIIPRSAAKPQKLRSIKASCVGQLVKLQGIVTRVTDVQPMVQVASYICSVCGYESFQTINDKVYTPLLDCPSDKCKANSEKGKLFAQTRGSKFLKYQELRLQEQPQEVPVGHIPRSMSIKCYGDLTRMCKPGDIITVAGIFLPSRHTGFRAIRAGLTADTYLHVMNLVPHKKSYTDFTLTDELMEEVQEKAEEDDIFDNLAASIAPEIFGHEDIKKALILLLVGGVTRNLPGGMKIRGDINCLLMGDPGVAKSQLLKHIVKIAPRAVYTTGKGSSGVGLTAAVIRDPITNEMTLEGGALVLADMGICCIDEFDKMEEGDRTAIHEVMEQQTVSIAKAGITTTLNARTAILAAANPAYGRWKPNMSAEENLNLPTALLSRFDFLFIIRDKPDETNDENLARHICYVHRHNTHPPLNWEPFTSPFLRAYISHARRFEPYVPESLVDDITQLYVGLRKAGVEDPNVNPNSKYNNRKSFCTPRSLLSILRGAQAHARLHFRGVVEKADVEEAIRLLNVAKDAGEDDKYEASEDFQSRIFKLLQRAWKSSSGQGGLPRANLLSQVVRAGFSEQQFNDTLEEYESLNILIAKPNYVVFTDQDMS